MNEIIRLINASNYSRTHIPVRHMFFSIFPGDVIYLIGLHRSGKTSLKKVLCGESPLTAGRLFVNGREYVSYDQVTAREEGIISIDLTSLQPINFMPIYEFLELFYSPHRENLFSVIHKKEVLKKVEALINRFHLPFKADSMTGDLSFSDIILLHLLAAVYSNAKLVIFNTASVSISHIVEQQITPLISRMTEDGIAFLFLDDSVPKQFVPGHVFLIRNGYIMKRFDKHHLNSIEIDHVLLSSEKFKSVQKDRRIIPTIAGIFELSHINSPLKQYCTEIYNQSELFDKHTPPADKILYLNTRDISTFCTNLSIGDNIALVRYPHIADRCGSIDNNVLSYLEKEFNVLIQKYGGTSKSDISELRWSDKKILGIERWVQAGYTYIVLEDLFFGLDTAGQQTIIKYLYDLADRGVHLLLIFYNTSILQEICSKTYICNCGKLQYVITHKS